jgi:hypothetical protein
MTRHFGGVGYVFGAVEALLLGRVGWGWMEVWCGDAMRSAGLRDLLRRAWRGCFEVDTCGLYGTLKSYVKFLNTIRMPVDTLVIQTQDRIQPRSGLGRFLPPSGVKDTCDFKSPRF